jgi:DNA-directed RNA polymerase beta subunit
MTFQKGGTKSKAKKESKETKLDPIKDDYSIEQDDLLLTMDAMIDEKGLISHHIESCDELYTIGISQIVSSVFQIDMSLDDIKRTTPEEQNIDHLDVLITFSNVVIDKPTMLNYNSGKEEILFPNVALAKEKTYKSNLRVDVHIRVTAVMVNGSTLVKEDTVKNFKICKMPIMVKTKWCNTYGLSKDSLTRLNEDPSDLGGYFIIRGVEWVLDCVENILFNKVRIFKNEGYKKEIMRAEYIAKPGDFYLNSDQFIARWLNDGQITLEIKREKLKDIKIPFYIIFRMMGWSTDKQIFDNILLGYDKPTSKNMIQYLKNAFDAKYTDLGKARYIYTQHDVLQYVAETIKDTSFHYLDVETYPEHYQKITNFLLENIDTHLLQHMGSSPASRDNKMRFLCVIIRKIFLTHLGNIEVTDRDSYNSKRIHAAGISYAKSFKTNFNASVIQHMRRKITKDLKTLSFNQIDLAASIKSSVFGVDFERSITQSITAGNKSQVTINNKARINRLSSQLLNRKNQLNVFSTLRQVTATTSDNSKQSERASEMRRVHMSFHGYICLIHSPEGEKVGVNKQLAMFALITKASFSEVIKDILLSDREIYPLSKTNHVMISSQNLCNVYVNGDWIGCCDDALAITKKYRQLRREFQISPEITIVWDNTQDEVYFWTDVGRVLRPLLIVYNNKRDADRFRWPRGDNGKANEFYQCLNIGADDVRDLYSKALDFNGLLRKNIVEFISAEEQENMYLCPDFDTLRENKNNELKEYTHCDVPQAMLGITGLTSPYASHNQAQRIVYQTSQSKQTCGLFAKNWAYRADKDAFLQYNNEMPVVKTLSNRYLHPNGSNCIIAIMCNTGYNVEDSIVMNQGAIDRGLFNGSKFTFYKTEIEQREEFANPDITNTTEIKSACYDKLVDGIIKVGTRVNKNDAIIGKVMKITKNSDDSYQFIDRSVIYKDNEPAIVHNVIVDRNEEDERFCKVVLRKSRPVQNGDKFSQLPTAQVLTDHGWLEIQHLDIEKHKVATLTLDEKLDYVKPTGLSSYEYHGNMYSLKTQQLEMFVTKNHKLYVKRRDKNLFQLLPTDDVIGKRVRFKKWAENGLPDVKVYTAIDSDGKKQDYPMDSWLKLLGMFIADGSCGNNKISFAGTKQRKKDFHKEFLNELGIKYCMMATKTQIAGEGKYKAIYTELKKLSVGALNKRLPNYVWNLSQRQSQILLNSLIEGDGSYNSNGSAGYFTSSPGLSDDVVRLALHSGWSGNAKTFNENSGKKKGDVYDITGANGKRSTGTINADCLYVRIIKSKNEPQINHGHVDEQRGQSEFYKEYKGVVYCLEVPDTHRHVYYSRETKFSPPCFTGNSSRSGQKSTNGLALRDSDMPSTIEGIRPSIILNPHAIPSRMTIGMLIENLSGTLCAEKCTQIDATIFKKVDLDSISNELEDLGLHRYGYRRLYNGITGTYIDTEIFIGPNYYQRLQKFTVDTIYSIANGPSDSLTYQQLDGGKANGGGLRIGEMERDVLCSHGSSKFISEKYFDHSDGYTEYVCRCGKSAVFNKEKKIYRCNYCQDNAEIIAYPTSWSSKLFMQEMESMNVGIKRLPTPFVYNQDNEKEINDMFDTIEDARK